MVLEITFFGGVGDYDKGELGGVQILFDDLEKKTKFLFDCGQRPDHTSEYYGFPYQPKSFQYLALSDFLELYPQLEGLYRHDYESYRNKKLGPLPLEGILLSHPHYDHMGGLLLVRYDLPIFMHPLALKMAWLWQYTSGRTTNQFVDLYAQLALIPNTEGSQRFAFGDEALLPRDIHTFKENQPFKIGETTIRPYLVDHSIIGSCGFILETSVGKIGLSGDLRKRGRRPQDTENFVNALLEQKVDYLFWEGSLLHFPHQGTEDDVSEVVSKLLKGKVFAAIAFPPRDFDRLTSLYHAAKDNKRMLVISPAQAQALKSLNGIHGFPRLDWKYLGVFLPRKRKGLLDRPEYPSEIIQQDYDSWERDFLEKEKWASHASKLQRVPLAAIKNYPEQFLVTLPAHQMLDVLEAVRPAYPSIYIRSHPVPWTPEMEIQEQRQINILKRFQMYDGPQPDYLTPSEERKMHQVHVTGHLNREETREILSHFTCPIIPYHCLNPQDFIDDVAKHTKVIIPQRGQKFAILPKNG